MPTFRLGGCLLVASVLLAPAAATAQDTTRTEVSGGYAWTSIEGENYPKGWYADVAQPIGEWFAVVGGVTGLHRSESRQFGNAGYFFDIEGSVAAYSFAGGGRFKLGGPPRAVVFAEALAGAFHLRGRARAHVTVPPGGTAPGDYDVTETLTKPMLQYGGGIHIGLTPRLKIRAAVHGFTVFNDEGENGDGVRVTTGLTFGF